MEGSKCKFESVRYLPETVLVWRQRVEEIQRVVVNLPLQEEKKE
jgi:hypothetical protein